MGYKGKNHVVMINWTTKSKMTMEEVIEQNHNTEIVLIDQMSHSPIEHERIHYVQGNATKIDTLTKANIMHAESICIFAPDFPQDLTSGDGKTILIASTIKHLAKQMNTDIYIIVEILDEEHLTNTNHDYIDKFILSNKPFSDLMAKTALQNQADTVS